MALMIRVEILVAIVAIVFLDSHDYDDYDYDPHLLGVEIQITATPHSPGDVGAIQQHDPSGMTVSFAVPPSLPIAKAKDLVFGSDDPVFVNGIDIDIHIDDPVRCCTVPMPLAGEALPMVGARGGGVPDALHSIPIDSIPSHPIHVVPFTSVADDAGLQSSNESRDQDGAELSSVAVRLHFFLLLATTRRHIPILLTFSPTRSTTGGRVVLGGDESWIRHAHARVPDAHRREEGAGRGEANLNQSMNPLIKESSNQ
eukprot:CAMPEP_0172378266 /NCGR_PEP_ID=MMETSP1060-20121228/69329_1 /TAXON_ID=37318 /ORGANISM="Pseudo-nitzschia pungens, Strain cf. cingulata" /LENGTH=255 /DNA_ID=CAMNT_0013105983 /DNA_START=1083 /DNA_END=1850 /DNA_ORIENTATION=+